MRNVIIWAAAVLLSAPSMAADMPVKAKPPLPAAPDVYNGSGFYALAGAAGTVGSINVAAPGDIARSIGAGAQGYGGVGYVKSFGNWYAAVELTGIYSGMSTAGKVCAAASCSLASGAGIEATTKVGVSNATFLNWLPNLNLGSIFPAFQEIPIGQSNPLAHYYVSVGGRFMDVSADYGLVVAHKWSNEFVVGIGMESQLTSSIVMDKWVRYSTSVGTISVPGGVAAAANVGSSWQALAGVSFKYGLTH